MPANTKENNREIANRARIDHANLIKKLTLLGQEPSVTLARELLNTNFVGGTCPAFLNASLSQIDLLSAAWPSIDLLTIDETIELLTQQDEFGNYLLRQLCMTPQGLTILKEKVFNEKNIHALVDSLEGKHFTSDTKTSPSALSCLLKNGAENVEFLFKLLLANNGALAKKIPNKKYGFASYKDMKRMFELWITNLEPESIENLCEIAEMSSVNISGYNDDSYTLLFETGGDADIITKRLCALTFAYGEYGLSEGDRKLKEQEFLSSIGLSPDRLLDFNEFSVQRVLAFAYKDDYLKERFHTDKSIWQSGPSGKYCKSLGIKKISLYKIYSEKKCRINELKQLQYDIGANIPLLKSKNISVKELLEQGLEPSLLDGHYTRNELDAAGCDLDYLIDKGYQVNLAVDDNLFWNEGWQFAACPDASVKEKRSELFTKSEVFGTIQRLIKDKQKLASGKIISDSIWASFGLRKMIDIEIEKKWKEKLGEERFNLLKKCGDNGLTPSDLLNWKDFNFYSASYLLTSIEKGQFSIDDAIAKIKQKPKPESNPNELTPPQLAALESCKKYNVTVDHIRKWGRNYTYLPLALANLVSKFGYSNEKALETVNGLTNEEHLQFVAAGMKPEDYNKEFNDTHLTVVQFREYLSLKRYGVTPDDIKLWNDSLINFRSQALLNKIFDAIEEKKSGSNDSSSDALLPREVLNDLIQNVTDMKIDASAIAEIQKKSQTRINTNLRNNSRDSDSQNESSMSRGPGRW